MHDKRPSKVHVFLKQFCKKLFPERNFFYRDHNGYIMFN